MPKLSNKEALSGVVSDFINSILKNRQPTSNGDLALSIVKILESADKSMNLMGSSVKINL